MQQSMARKFSSVSWFSLIPRWLMLLFSILILGRYSYGVIHHYADMHGVIFTSSDSHQFMAGAKSFASTFEFRALDGIYQVRWTPLFSAGVALVSWLWDTNLGSGSVIFQSLCVGGLAAICLYLLAQVAGINLLFSFLISLILVRSFPVMWSSTRLLADSLYLSMTFMSIAGLTAMYRRKTIGAAIFTGVSLGLTFLAKYLGLALFLSAGFVYLYQITEGSLKNLKKLRMRKFFDPHWLVVFTLGAIPVVYWTIRNALLSGSPMGFHAAGSHSFFSMSMEFATEVGAVFLPSFLYPFAWLYTGILVFAVIKGHRSIKFQLEGFKSLMMVLYLTLAGIGITIFCAKTMRSLDGGMRMYISFIIVVVVIMAMQFIANLFGGTPDHRGYTKISISTPSIWFFGVIIFSISNVVINGIKYYSPIY